MTTDRTPPTGGLHPSDEGLSAFIDGDPAAAAHVRRCRDCRARADQLQGAARAVATPVALPSADAREAAIARAVAAASPAGIGAAPRARERWVLRFRWRALAGVGAAAVVAASIVLLVALPRHDRHTTTVALRNQNAATAPTSTTGGMAFGVNGGAGSTSASRERASAAPAAGGVQQLQTAPLADLGDVPDGAALRARVGPAVHRRPTSDQTAAASAGASGAGSTSQGPTPMAASAPAGPPERSADTSASDVPPPYSGPPPPCEAAARSLGPAQDRLVYAATAKWQGTPAVVLAFVPEPPAAGAVRVYVMEEGSCRLLYSDAYDQ